MKVTSMTASHNALMNAYSRQPISFVRGAGAHLWDSEGNVYLDAIAGVGVTNLGHAHPEITEVIAEQAALLMHTSNMFDITWQERLGERLTALSGMDRAFFCNSGSEANEAALKLAWLHARSKHIVQPKILVMERAFHGRTIATLAATGNPTVHRGFDPLMPIFVRVPLNDIEAVREAAEREPDIAAVLLEPVQGEGGVHVAQPDYLQVLRQFCDEQDWLMIVDEVQTGIARAGSWFCFQQAGIVPDVVLAAKGLGNGFPIGACLAHGKAAALFTPGNHGSTYGGNPLACRVACTVLDIIERDNIIANARIMGERLGKSMRTSLSTNREVAEIRGHGMMLGIELTRPCEDLVAKALLQEKLVIAVTRGKTIRLLPPLICTEAEVDQIVQGVASLLH